MATFRGHLTTLASRRIGKEVERSEKDSLSEHNIWYKFDPQDTTQVKALIIGPTETPYADGFYFFSLHLPDTYPLHPPKVKFCTTDGTIRFHPNLYACGKVCLSILGTWPGPKWVSSQSVETVLLSISSLLTKNPIQHEPGHEKDTSLRSQLYNTQVAFEAQRYAVLTMLETPPTTFEVFLPTMRSHFTKRKLEVEKAIADPVFRNLVVRRGSTIYPDFVTKADYSELRSLFDRVAKGIEEAECEDLSPKETASEETTIEETTVTEITVTEITVTETTV
eukprot:Platyproteum_vivax@DN312_c0_g1_i1.p1